MDTRFLFITIFGILCFLDSAKSQNDTATPEQNSTISEILELSDDIQSNDTQRQRRLIPYNQFYIPQSPHNPRYQYQPNAKHPAPIYKLVPQKTRYIQPKPQHNPFSDVNKLPGGFTPMLNYPEQLTQDPELYKQMVHQQLAHPSIGYASVQTPKPVYKIRRPTYIPYPRYKSPTKTFVQSYKPEFRPSESIKYTPEVEAVKYEEKYIPEPVTFAPEVVYVTTAKPQEEISVTPKPVFIHNENTLTQVLKMLPQFNPAPQQFPTDEEPQTPKPNSLGHLLKALQYSNALPQTFTTNNIGTSIKTLLNILNALQAQNNKMQYVIPATIPAITSNTAEYEPVTSNKAEFTKPELEPEIHTPEVVQTVVQTPAALVANDPAAITQFYPQPTLDGGTPGKPGVDYPAYDTIPQTSFDCKTQRYKGFFGDPETNCQVWHYCDLNGGQASFLCPNGTIFSQVALTCDWWYNVKCSNTHQLYVLNERLYKYILPFTPKFPEDYSGPLVDRYITQKFKEQEEELRRKKKGKTKPTEEEVNENTEELQDLENQPEIDRKDVKS